MQIIEVSLMDFKAKVADSLIKTFFSFLLFNEILIFFFSLHKAKDKQFFSCFNFLYYPQTKIVCMKLINTKDKKPRQFEKR